MTVSIVIPVYNEEKRIKKTLDSIVRQIKNWQEKIEIVFANDGSKDNTVAVINSVLAGEEVEYKIVGHAVNLGKGAAIKAGMLAAKGDVVVLFDADNATEINNFLSLKEDLKGCDIVIGSRYLASSQIIRQQSILRRVLSRLGNLLIKIMVGLNFKDTQCGFKVLKREVAKEITKRLTINRWGFDIELLAIAKKLNYSIKEAPVSWLDQSGSRLRAGRAAWQTLGDLVKIKINLVSGVYK